MGHRSAHSISKKTAGNLLQDSHVSPAIIASTLYIEELKDDSREMIGCRAKKAFAVGRMVIEVGQAYILFRSKWSGRYFVVASQRGVLTCSAYGQERFAARCVGRVHALLNERATRSVA